MRGALSGRMRDPERRFYQPWPVPLGSFSFSLASEMEVRGAMCARLGKQTAKFISPFRITRAQEKIFALSFYNNMRENLFLPGDATCLLKLRASTLTPCPRAQDFWPVTHLGSLGWSEFVELVWKEARHPEGQGFSPKVAAGCIRHCCAVTWLVPNKLCAHCTSVISGERSQSRVRIIWQLRLREIMIMI